MDEQTLSDLTITDVTFLPVVKEYARKINLVETINHMVDTEMEIQPGPVVLAMVLDTLSGRSLKWTPMSRQFFIQFKL